MKKRITAIIISLCMMMGSVVAFAAEETLQITTAEELADAIAAQADGQVWELAAGTYDLTEPLMEKYGDIEINGATDFVFPITANHLTIKGSEGTVITSSFDPNSGIWSAQNFVTVKGQGVTIENLQLKGNKNSYYDSCNKVIELIDTAKDFTLRNVDLLSLTDADGKVNSGSVYINVEDAGNTVLEDVTMASWINARAVSSGTVIVKNVVQDFTNNTYAGYYSEEYGYAWNPGVSGDNSKITLNNLTIKVDHNTAFVEQLMKEPKPGTVIELTEDITINEEIYIQTNQFTINGNGHTVTASDQFKVNSEGQINLVKIQADNVTLKNIQLVTNENMVADRSAHTLDIYGSQNVALENVTLNHEKIGATKGGAPLVINGSEVVVKGDLKIVTGDKSWYGINVDNKNGDASITFAENSNLQMQNNGDKDLVVIYPEAKEGTDANQLVINPENAGIVQNEDGTYREEIKATELKLDVETKTINVGESFTLVAAITPENADNKTVAWTSSDSAVATVDENGKVTAVAAGNAVITAKLGELTAVCNVTVEKVAEQLPSTPDEDNGKTGVNSNLVLFLFFTVISAGAIVMTSKKATK